MAEVLEDLVRAVMGPLMVVMGEMVAMVGMEVWVIFSRHPASFNQSMLERLLFQGVGDLEDSPMVPTVEMEGWVDLEVEAVPVVTLDGLALKVLQA